MSNKNSAEFAKDFLGQLEVEARKYLMEIRGVFDKFSGGILDFVINQAGRSSVAQAGASLLFLINGIPGLPLADSSFKAKPMEGAHATDVTHHFEYSPDKVEDKASLVASSDQQKWQRRADQPRNLGRGIDYSKSNTRNEHRKSTQVASQPFPDNFAHGTSFVSAERSTPQQDASRILDLYLAKTHPEISLGSAESTRFALTGITFVSGADERLPSGSSMLLHSETDQSGKPDEAHLFLAQRLDENGNLIGFDLVTRQAGNSLIPFESASSVSFDNMKVTPGEVVVENGVVYLKVGGFTLVSYPLEQEGASQIASVFVPGVQGTSSEMHLAMPVKNDVLPTPASPGEDNPEVDPTPDTFHVDPDYATIGDGVHAFIGDYPVSLHVGASLKNKFGDVVLDESTLKELAKQMEFKEWQEHKGPEAVGFTYKDFLTLVATAEGGDEKALDLLTYLLPMNSLSDVDGFTPTIDRRVVPLIGGGLSEDGALRFDETQIVIQSYDPRKVTNLTLDPRSYGAQAGASVNFLIDKDGKVIKVYYLAVPWHDRRELDNKVAANYLAMLPRIVGSNNGATVDFHSALTTEEDNFFALLMKSLRLVW